MKNQIQVLKNSFKKLKVFGKVKKSMEEIVPAVYLIAILILVLPAF